MAFDITSVLKTAVSESDTGAGQQISYLPVDRIDPDPDNFYSLEGINELADNIAMVGLQQPLLVREGSEPGRYTIVSGHRRFAAIKLLQDGEDERERRMFDHGVPCIIQYESPFIFKGSEVDKALQELRLIYANASTRVLSAAEISRQAERIEALLLALKDQGYAFPGRMRNHVAQICQVSKSKIARLHAIRENLQPELLERFDRGELNESVAYRISQETNAVQSSLAKIAGDSLPQYDVPRVESTLVGIKNPPRTTAAPAEAGGFDPEAYLEERAEEDREFFEGIRDHADLFLTMVGRPESRQHGIEQLKRNCRQAGHAGGAGRDWSGSGVGLTMNDLSNHPILRSWTETYDMICLVALERIAKEAGKKATRKDPPPSPAGGLTWSTGTPTEPGMYETRIGVADAESAQTTSWQRLLWTSHGWAYNGTLAPLPAGTKVYRWVRLPEV